MAQVGATDQNVATVTFFWPLMFNCFYMFFYIISPLIIPWEPQFLYFHGNFLILISYIGIAFNIFCTLVDQLFDITLLNIIINKMTNHFWHLVFLPLNHLASLYPTLVFYPSSTGLPSPYLPFAVYLYSLALFSTAHLIFKSMTPFYYYHNGNQLEQFPGNDSCFSGLLYGILFYSIPTVEYYTELVYLPEIKEWSVWTLGAISSLPQHLVKLAVGSIAYPLVCTLYGVFYIFRSFRLISGRRINVAQSSMELLMHVFAQFLLRNPFSLVFVVIVWSVWKVVSPLPNAYDEDDEFEYNYQHIDYWPRSQDKVKENQDEAALKAKNLNERLVPFAVEKLKTLLASEQECKV